MTSYMTNHPAFYALDDPIYDQISVAKTCGKFDIYTRSALLVERVVVSSVTMEIVSNFWGVDARSAFSQNEP